MRFGLSFTLRFKSLKTDHLENSFQGEDVQELCFQCWQVGLKNGAFEKRWCHQLNSCMPIVALCYQHVPETTTTADCRFVYIWLAC